MKQMSNIKKIAIIGAGWYGCHLANYLKKNRIFVKIFEKNSDIFMGSSGYNQYRFHKGFHYPRSKSTIQDIKINSKKFLKLYKNFIKFPNNNYYSIAKKKSLIDFDTYKDILKINKIKFTKCKKLNFVNYDTIEGVIKCPEGVILNDKLKRYFKKILKENIVYNTQIKNIQNLKKNYDLVIDCSNNTCKNNFGNKARYYLTISFIFKSRNNKNLPSLTIMDGKLPSLYEYSDKKNFYTLTHSKHTHIKKFNKFIDLIKFKNAFSKKKIVYLKKKSVSSISSFYKNFESKFSYKGHFFSYKILPIDSSDKRETFYYNKDNYISIFSPKIANIFNAEKVINKIVFKK